MTSNVVSFPAAQVPATHDAARDVFLRERARILRRIEAGELEFQGNKLTETLDIIDRTLRLIEQDRHGAANLELVFPIEEQADHS